MSDDIVRPPGAAAAPRPRRAGIRWQRVAVVAIVALTLVVAALVERPAPDFAAPPFAVVRNAAGQDEWAIRLAPAAHEIGVEALGAAPPAVGHRYWLWLLTPQGPRSLGIVPPGGHRKTIPEIPTLVRSLAGGGELIVSAEPGKGPSPYQPQGPVIGHAAFPGP